jgi:transposase
MADKLTVQSERVDDIPVLVMHQEGMGVPNLLDELYVSHGNRRGLSLGWLATMWLTYVVSESDHRLSHVRRWARQRLETLQRCSGQVVTELDFADDRLADVLQALSDDVRWSAFEKALNGNLLRVYDLSTERIRVDATTASGYWTVTEEGLLQFGHSKDHRPDLPQVKVMLSSLDPLGMPVATQVVSGERADDPLYRPAIAQVRQGLGRRGLLYIGDSKMGALETRAFVQAGGDYYLCPLGLVQLPEEVVHSYLAPVWAEEQGLKPIYRQREGGRQEQIAEGFERTEELTAQVNGQTVSWTERRLVVRSLSLAKKAVRGLHARLSRAQAELAALNVRKRGKKVWREAVELRQAAETILVRRGIVDLVQVDIEEIIHERRLRAYGQRPATIRVEKELRLHVTVNEQAVYEREQTLGWRVYATNQRPKRLSLNQAVLAYRDQYGIEHSFHRLKGKPLSLTPMYLRSDERVKGLIRLLTIGLRVLTLLEFVVRRRLAQAHIALTGLYTDSPKHATTRPTAERLLEAFKGITLTIIRLGDQIHRHVTPLSDLQRRILGLLGLSTDIYTRLSAISAQPP